MSSLFFSLAPFSFSFFLLLGSIAAIAQPTGDTTGIVNVPIDIERSTITWKGTEMLQSGKHEGTVNLSAGYLELIEGRIVGGKFIADMNSIAITDIPKHEPVPRNRLRDHLKSEDFFHVEEYPEATFEIKKAEQFKPDSVRVCGDLSIRDVTKTISIVASKKSDIDSILVFEATFKIDRFAWNISYQGSYWKRITSVLDNTFVDADIFLTLQLFTSSQEKAVQ